MNCVERFKEIWTLLFLACLPLLATGQGRTWDLTISGGAAYNFPLRLQIFQTEQEPLTLTAKYKTKPFNPPFYYDIRLATEKNQRGFELKLTHHKLILQNRLPDIQRFSITDGFNLFTLSRVWGEKYLNWSVGAGIVITHPESTIRNLVFPENNGLFNRGYYVSGPVAELAISRKQYINRRWFLSGQARMTGSYVQVPVASGYANVTNLSMHFLLGVGYAWKRMEKR